MSWHWEDTIREKEAEIARLRERLDNYVNTIGRENIELEEANEKLRAALEEIQMLKIIDGSGEEVAEDSLHEIRKIARKALNEQGK